jgi:hypothetical protein
MNRVLLVEDNPDDLELAQLAFERGVYWLGLNLTETCS